MSFSTSTKKVIRSLLKSFTLSVVTAVKTAVSTVHMDTTRRKTRRKTFSHEQLRNISNQHRQARQQNIDTRSLRGLGQFPEKSKKG